MGDDPIGHFSKLWDLVEKIMRVVGSFALAIVLLVGLALWGPSSVPFWMKIAALTWGLLTLSWLAVFVTGILTAMMWLAYRRLPKVK